MESALLVEQIENAEARLKQGDLDGAVERIEEAIRLVAQERDDE